MARAVLAFAMTGLVVLVLVGIAGVLVMRRLGTEQALRQAERIALVAGQGVVEPRLTNGILRGDSASLLAIDELVNGGVLRGPIARVSIRDTDGRVLYADQPDAIGSTIALRAAEREALRTGSATTSESDEQEPDARVPDLGPLLEVSLPVTTPGGHVLLFQASIPRDSVSASAEQLWRAFLPVLAVALVALALVQIRWPCGWPDRSVPPSRSESSSCGGRSNPRIWSDAGSPEISTTDRSRSSRGCRCRSPPTPTPWHPRTRPPRHSVKPQQRHVGASACCDRR